MPFSMRTVPSLPLRSVLIGAFLLASAGPARADDDDRDGKLSAREVMEGVHDVAKERSKFFFGTDESPDPVIGRGGHRFQGDRPGDFHDPEKARRLVAEEILDGVEARLNQGKWIPFRHRDRKTTGPDVLFGLDDPSPGIPVMTDSWTSRFRVSLVRGLEYRQEFATGDRNRKLQMRVFGPIVPGGPGLGLQLKGHVLDRRFRLNAYGGTNEAGLTMDFEF
jgi:hypothetical protein